MRPGRRRAFTLLEILIAVAIIGVLLSLVLPLARRTLASARAFKCQMGLRNIAYDFALFADDTLHSNRGNDENETPRGMFSLETFQASEYCVNEFWCFDGEDRHELPDLAGNDPMRCPEVRGKLILRSNFPCTGGAVSPWENVSFGFNVRLRVAERVSPPGSSTFKLSSRIMAEGNVPLLWDVDGAAAAARGHPPFFSGPSLDSPMAFANDQYWFPGMRHNGTGNFAFIDGHVAASRRPLDETGWRWGYVPPH